jgi:two-component system sensor histidine kinase/response regulator
VRTLAHELRNPLNAALGPIHLLLQAGDSIDAPQRDHFIGMVARNLARASELLDDLPAFAVGRPRAPRPRPLREVVDDAFHEVRAHARSSDVQMRVLEPLPNVSVDAAVATLVLMNLVWNGVKYADPAKSPRWVSVGAHASGDALTVVVSDNGLGIAEQSLTDIFEPFRRLHPVVASGHGLGLAISRDLLASAGGCIWVESEEYLGSSFFFRMATAQASP